MNDRNSYGRHDDRHEETSYSRLFVVCSKSVTDDDLNKAFSPYGTIEKLHVPRDRNTGNSKGIAYITYSKISEAALAIQEMSNKALGPEKKPVKVMIASSKDDDSDINEENCKRLFIVCPKTATETELRNYFSVYGKLDAVYIQKNRATDESKGFAYICYKTFLSAAIALEECDRKYKPVFAKPKKTLKRPPYIDPGFNHNVEPKNMRFGNDRHNLHKLHTNDYNMMNSNSDAFTSVRCLCSLQLSRQNIEQLFNVVPGMESCHYTIEDGHGTAIITYNTHSFAAHAVQRLNNFEYPLGEYLVVKPENLLVKVANDLNNMVQNIKEAVSSRNPMTNIAQLASVMSQASSLLKSATGNGLENFGPICSVSLPPPQPHVDFDSPVAKRCFIVCKPSPLPLDVLQDVFCRFGDFIDVYIMPNKNYGFARYASMEAADNAIKTLNGSTVRGVSLKVIEAEDKKKDKGDNQNNPNDNCV